ncbi:MAG TPA: hypothetical protein PLF42_10840 [Anaerolineales bacterium]|nr:hypothetical protein [Anaerolineales bacterium]
MKRTHLFYALVVLVAILIATLTILNFFPSFALTQHATGALQQVTPTPPADSSEIGSTDGILIMGFVIALIVTLPLIFRKQGK